MTEKNIYVLAFYCFTPIESPEEEVRRHKAFFEGRDAKARLYISQEGLNAQMSIAKDDALAYMEWLKSDPRFKEIEFKLHYADEHVFPKLTIKVRKQLVALDVAVDMRLTGEHVSADKWKEMLEERDEDTILLDVRNDYEWEIGHFEGAELPQLETFREFPKYVQKLKKEKDVNKTKVMMYCTGGIRCELYSALLKQEGFQNVYQLQGGVIKYGLQKGSDKWKGKLFVFDDRLAVPLKEGEKTEVISHCIHCKEKADSYYNCANMDCNELFISCKSCAEKQKGCCCEDCQSAPRLRPFDKELSPKPFRKWYHYREDKASLKAPSITPPLEPQRS